MATDINEEMKLSATYAIAEYIDDKDLSIENIIPSALDRKVAEKVAKAVAAAAEKSGAVRKM